MVSKFFPLCAFATVCVFVASAIPAEAGRRGTRTTTTFTPPPIVIVTDAPVVSAQ